MQQHFFTADTHLGHRSICRHQPETRAFASIEEHDRQLIANINEVVGERDVLWVLGDFAFCSPSSNALAYRQKIKCQTVHLVMGNHDDFSLTKARSIFSSAEHFREVKLQDQDAAGGSQLIVLCHYALRTWRKSAAGSWHLHGHSHGSLPDMAHARSMDVGVDCHGLYPISYSQVKSTLLAKDLRSIDHHRVKL